MIAESPTTGPVTSWLRIASDPSLSASLHPIFGEFCHECRNNLQALKLSLYLARRGAGTADQAVWDQFEPSYKAIERLFDRLQMIYKPMVLETVRLPLELFIEERRTGWDRALARSGRTLDLDPPRGPTVGAFDPSRLGIGLDTFIAWRAEVGDAVRPARLTWAAEAGQFHILWSEPGARTSQEFESLEDRFERLALPLLVRIISAHHGAVEVASDDGLQVHLRWPQDGRPS